jgi:hypothetical protein
LQVFCFESLNPFIPSVDWLVALISTAKIIWICRDKG